MIAGKYNIEMEQGSVYQKLFTVKRNGSAEDLSAYTKARMEIRKTPNGAKIWDSDDDPSYLVLDGNAGTIALLISSDITAGFTFTEAEYDIELQTADGKGNQKYLKGKIVLDKEITR